MTIPINEFVALVNALPLPELGKEKEYADSKHRLSDGSVLELTLWAGPSKWFTGKNWTTHAFDEIVLSTELVDCHYSDWQENLGIREPYRHLAVWKADFNTSDALIEFAREHKHWHTNKMLAVIDIDRPARRLLCMSCYDACWTYFSKIEVKT